MFVWSVEGGTGYGPASPFWGRPMRGSRVTRGCGLEVSETTLEERGSDDGKDCGAILFLVI